MRRIRFVFTPFLFVVCISVGAFAQTAPPKSVLINTAAFYDERIGITKLVKAEKELEAAFAAQIKALQDDNAKIQAIAKELQTVPPNLANSAAMAAKQEEGESLQRHAELKKAELEAEINKKRQILIGPINEDIGKAINEFGKKNGYGAIFDASKLAESGVLLFVAESTDITKDFIAFYNARSAAIPIAE